MKRNLLNARWLQFAVYSITLSLIIVVVGHSARFVFQDDVQDDLRHGDMLFATKRYHEARTSYYKITNQKPDFALGFARRGMVEVIRGEHEASAKSFARAIHLGITGTNHDIARLYQGHVSSTIGRHSEATSMWRTINEGSEIYPLRRVLEAESLLRIHDYASAEATYREALHYHLPKEWQVLIHGRLATLRASSDPVSALQELQYIDNLSQSDYAVSLPSVTALTMPLLPIAEPTPQQLAAILRTNTEERPQLLGQIYLDAGFFPLAEAQFAQVDSENPNALSAAAYAAYTRWLAGDQQGGRTQLETLVEEHPEESRARALLALTYIAQNDSANARTQLEIIRGMAPQAPDTHLAWGQWYAAQRDYIAAAASYRRALEDAPLDERGKYALALARFHADTTVELCDQGQLAAEEAVQLLPDASTAWTTLAITRFRCEDYPGAKAAATRALELDTNNIEATYYLGRALALLGDRDGARVALINTADMAPASSWRERAETQLTTLGL
ncbi:MAG: tetratricopeptide repeat protein [Chloroflexota bacterium]